MLTIIISTWEDGIFNLERTVRLRHPLVSYLIIHQTQKEPVAPDYLINRPDVDIVSSYTRGLSVSRNIGLRNCKTRYALIADDDVEYIPAGIEELLKTIEQSKPNFGLFKIQTLDGEPEYKRYPKESYEIRELKHWVSSIEILIDIDKIREYNVCFDERFGLGAPLDRGEEEVFVHDLISHGLRGVYYPLYIVKHPHMSSGKKSRAVGEHWFVRGALDKRMGKQLSLREIREELPLKDDMPIAEIYYDKGRAWVGQSD